MNNVYINIGTPKCCLFVKTSMFLIKQFDKNPFLFFAVEEALECAKNQYYASGILTFSQLLNLLNEATPKNRHMVAHEILKNKPTKEMYEEIKEKFEKAASNINIKEIKQHSDIKQYEEKISRSWNDFMAKINPNWKEIIINSNTRG